MKDFFKGLKTVSLGTWIRTALMVLALVNMVLEICGKGVLPISDEQVSELITYIFTAVVFIINWWKNNSFTLAAQKADKVLHGEVAEESIEEAE